MFKFAASLFRKYDDLLIAHPLLMKMATAGVISSTGDILCQRIVENKSWEEYNPLRTLSQMTVGVFFMAPGAHNWFGKVLPIFINPLKNKSAKLMGSIFLDNTVYGAFMPASSIFFFGMFRTQSIAGSIQKVEDKFERIYTGIVQYSCVISFFNHILWPGRYKGIFSNASGVVWKIYLSYLLHANDRIPAVVGGI